MIIITLKCRIICIKCVTLLQKHSRKGGTVLPNYELCNICNQIISAEVAGKNESVPHLQKSTLLHFKVFMEQEI